MNEYVDSNPWAGLSSYEDPDKAEREGRKPKLFCGRDDESHNVTQLITGNIFVTLYGKSGTGKTSLLNAGVFPHLRQKRYLPVSIRLSMDALDTTFQQAIVHQLSQALQFVGGQERTIDVVPLPNNEQQPDYLWAFFARTRFLNANGQTLFPVIVLDQFEEIFRDRRNEAEALLRQIAYLMDESHALSPRLVDGQSFKYDFNFRFVASIREDDLYRLEDSIDNNYLPELKRCRYRLRSLTDQGARDAILIPGEHLFLPEEQNGIVSSIIDKSRNEDGSISTNIVSLLCNRIYVDYQRSGADHITPTLVDSFLKGNPFERFYNEATRGFSNREKSYIEDHLVDSTGRRNSIPESDFQKHVKNGAILLEGERKILQRTSTSSDGGNYRIELIHDSFCEPLRKLKDKRQRRKKLWTTFLIASIFATCLGVMTYILYLDFDNKKLSIENQNQVLTISLRERELETKNIQLETQNLQLKEETIRANIALNERDKALIDLQKAKKEIEVRYSELEEVNRQIEQEQLKTQLANTEATKNIIRLRMELANNCINNGDSYTARLLALEALTNKDNPYIPEAEAMLRKASYYNGAVLDAFFSTPLECKFTPDGNFIISSGENLKIWDANNGALIKTFSNICYAPISTRDKEVLIANGTTIMRFDKDWNLIPVNNFDRKVSFFPMNSNNYVYQYRGLSKSLIDSIVVVFDSQTGDSLLTLAHNKRINSIYYSHDGNLIVTASEDNSIKIWNAKTGDLQKTLLGHLPTPSPRFDTPYLANNGVMYAQFNSNDSIVYSCSRDKTIRLWDVASCDCLDTISFSSPVICFVVDKDDNYIWAGCEDGNIYGYNLQNRQMLTTLKGHNGAVINISFSPNFKRIVSIGNDGDIRIWDGHFRDLIYQMKGHTGFGHDVSYSPKGDLVVTASADSTVGLWYGSGRLIKKMVGHTGSVLSAEFSRDGKFIVSASTDSTIRIWDVQKRKEIRKLTGHHNRVNNATFSPNGKQIISTSGDSTIRMWSVATGECTDSIFYNQEYNHIKYSSDGRNFYANVNSKIYKFNLLTKQIIDSIGDKNDFNITSYNFSPDSTLIIYSIIDNISIWDVKQKKVKLTWKNKEKENISHVEFSRDGKYCLSVGLWSPLQIWDVNTGILIKEYIDNRNSVSASFRPLDRYNYSEIVTTGGDLGNEKGDNKTEMWKLPFLEELIEETEERFKNRKLTPEECQKYNLE